MTNLDARHLVALAAVAVLLGGCSPNAADGDPQPPTSSPTAGPDDEAAMIDAETAVAQYTALQHAIIQLAPMDPADIDIEGAGAGIVVGDSPADEFLTDRLSVIAETGSGPSGQVTHAEVIRPASDGAEQQRVELCALQETEPVDIATGEPAPAVPESTPTYTRFEVIYQFVDGDWLVEDIPALRAEEPPADCVPPSIAEEVEANWEAHDEAVQAWVDSSFGLEEREALEPLVTDARWEQILETEPVEPTGRVRGDIAYDLELIRATRTEVSGEWCLDGNRDPDAMTIIDGELVKDEMRALSRGRWQLQDGEWRFAETVESEGDGIVVAGSPDAPEGHRCL
ncbi:hypothetical protein [Nitriliruptor alkaliphilus]|uniref:hypothetical protein n=1 Tax=Nitriliruptor alkaliphilus TaxID=427918 RepID=UPI000696DFAC|nr:hypothetical protein [Nitriliruptor alkaliphilus]